MILLLSRSVPDLDCHDGVVDDHLFLLEVSPDCWLHILRDLALRVPEEEGRLAYVCLAQDDDFEEVLLLHGLIGVHYFIDI